jgi:diaminohydroxyphosphoribosylaminopyrimidine deaminase / 5-amino-6-(5-phosphoribosylamino)uracil reductase
MEEKEVIKFMRRCLELAVKAEGLTYPNPMVGSVIEHSGKIIGEGYHLKAGGAHAEVIAINSIRDIELLKEATLFVNLEPCSHTGKTPPCADFIISHRIPRVVVGSIDTSDQVTGNGITKLKKAGCEVITGVLEEECRKLNRRFFTFHEKRRPYITLKWAQSADGFLDVVRTEGHDQTPSWISGKPERILVHKWRSSEQSILIGAGTLRADNPKLNVREWKGNDPMRLILSSSGLVGEGWSANETKDTDIVFTHNNDAATGAAVKVKLKDDEESARQVIDYLYDLGIQSVFIEGGSKVLNHFISSGLWDEVRIFCGNTCFYDGVKAPILKANIFTVTTFRTSSLQMAYNDVS